MNVFQTGILLAALTGLFGVVGYALGGGSGMAVALAIGAATNLFALWNSDRMVLSAHNAREVDAASAPDLFRMVADLAARAGLPMPRVYVMQDDQPNAFATGRSPERAAVAVTTGLMRMLSREELAGVIAHELAHIRNRDTLIMTISATVAGAVSSLAHFGMIFGGRSDGRRSPLAGILVAMLAPIAAMIIQMAISRTREFAADRLGGEIVGNPAWLAAALEKIAGGVARIESPAAEANPAHAHMFILNPLAGGGIGRLFSTHPDTGQRIAALMQQAAAMGLAPAADGFMAGAARSPWSRR
jgi:heat shock protein HtpX